MAVSHGLPRALRALPLSLLLLALLSAMLGSVNAVAKFSSGSSPIVSAHSLRPVGISLSPKISTSARMRLAAADNLDGSEDADSNDELVLDLPHFFSNGSSISVSLRPVQHPAASQGYIEPMANFHDADQSVERVGSSISCLYRGHVVGQPQNRVVLSVCDGRVHGTIMHEGKIHQIMAANTFRALSAPHELELYNTLNTDAELAAASAAVAEAALDAHSYTEVPHLAFVLGAETAPEEVAGAATDDAPWCDGPLLPPGAPAKADAAPVAMASETGSSSEIVVTNYFIEVMAYVDYSLYAALTQEGMSKKQIIDYVRALFLQVEATYHESAFPEDMKVYVNPSRIEVITASTGNHFDIVQDSRTTLPAFSAWQAQAFPPGSSLRNFDIAVLLTHNRFLNNVAGLAYVGTACSLPESASCINTVNSFGSWAVVSHEIGHVLNASHDGENGCSPKGYVMAPTVGGFEPVPPQFSSCSVAQIKDKILSTNCMNQPTTRNEHPKCLKEKGVLSCFDPSLDCRMMGFETDCDFSTPNICRIWCTVPSGSCSSNNFLRPNGFNCTALARTGVESHCLHGECVAVESNPVPTFAPTPNGAPAGVSLSGILSFGALLAVANAALALLH